MLTKCQQIIQSKTITNKNCINRMMHHVYYANKIMQSDMTDYSLQEIAEICSIP